MSFAYPWILAIGCVLLAAAARLVVGGERARRRALARFGEVAVLEHGSMLPAPRRSSRVQALRLAALAFGIVALARPQLGERAGEMVRTGRDVLLLLDLSRSMGVTDVSARPGQSSRTRLAVAKQVAWDVLSAYPGDRVGLIVFGGSGFLQLPLNSDRASLRRFLDAASPDDLGDPATDVSAALLTAVSAFEHEGEAGRRAVLIVTDGESGEGEIERASEALRREQLPVLAIGVGSAEGGPVPADSSEAPEPYHRNHIGQIVVSRLEEGELREVARASGGSFARWDRSDQLRALVTRLGQVKPRTLAATRRSNQRADRYQWPLALMVLALLGAELVPPSARNARRGWRAPWASSAAPAARGQPARVAILLMVAVTSLSCSAARRGERLYHRGKFPEAYEVFRRGLERDSSARLAFDAGSALYRLERYDEAVAAFRQASLSPERRQQSLYNLGNALVRAAEERPGEPAPLLDAVAAYEEALRLAPADPDTRWNLELALRRLEDDRTRGGSAGRSRAGDYGRGQNTVPGYEGNPDAAVGAMAGGGYGSAEGESVNELSADEARRLLEAVERQQLTSHEGRRSKAGSAGERDW